MLYFNELNAVGMTLYFMIKNNKSKIEHLRLMKLLYLAERESLNNCGSLISYDTAIALPNGPALEHIKSIIGTPNIVAPIWDKFISRKDGDFISLKQDVDIKINDIDFISQSKLDVLEQIWLLHKDKSTKELVDYTHDNCEEWITATESHEISVKAILKSLGKTSSEIRSIENYISDVSPMTVLQRN